MSSDLPILESSVVEAFVALDADVLLHYMSIHNHSFRKKMLG